MPALPVGATWDPKTKKWGIDPKRFNADGTVKPVVPDRRPGAPGSTPPTTPGKNKNKGKVGKTNINAWLNGMDAGGGGDSADLFNPLKGLPGLTELDPFPTMETLPDGSKVKNTKSTPLQLGKASLLDPSKYADLMGKKSYQPIIDAIKTQQGQLTAGIGQANATIDQGYGAAGAQDLEGRQKILDATSTASRGLTDLAARMAAAAGGDPTAAAALGRSTADSQAALQGFSNIAAEGQSDQAAAAARDAANAKLGYSAAANAKIGELGLQGAQAQTEGSQAQGKALMDALGFNSDQKTSQLGRDVSKQDAFLAAALAGRQITAADLANVGTRQGLGINKHNAEVNDWSALTTAKQNQYTQSVERWTNKNLATQLKTQLSQGKKPAVLLALADPSARAAVAQDVLGPVVRDGSPILQPDKMWTHIRTALRSSYGDAPPKARDALAKIYMEQTLRQWEADHPNATHKWNVDASGAPHLVKK